MGKWMQFLKRKNKVTYFHHVLHGVFAIVVTFVIAEIALWITLSNTVYNKSFLAWTLFGLCNMILIAGIFLYLWLCKNDIREMEQLLPTMNRYHRQSLSLQDEIFMNYILLQLLKGRYPSVDYEEYFKNNTQFDFIHREYRVVVFVPENEMDIASDAFQLCHLAFCDVAKNHVSIYMLEIDHMLVGICFPKHEKTFDQDNSWLELIRYLNYVQVQVEEKTDTHLYIAAGGRHKGLAALSKGFHEAMSAYKYQEVFEDENSLIFYNNIDFPNYDDETSFQDDVWYEKERKLLYQINNGDYSNSTKTMEEIINLIGNCGHHSFQMMKYKVFALINTLYIDLMEKQNMAKELLNINATYLISNCKSITDLQGTVKIIYQALVNGVKPEEDGETSKDRTKDITNYLQENYHNMDLNIVYVAEQFHLTPPYLSRIFKKEMGIGPAEYLQRIRIDAVKDLLLHSNMTIKEISESAGYQYVLTMNRAFKKFEGMTPSQYIEKNK